MWKVRLLLSSLCPLVSQGKLSVLLLAPCIFPYARPLPPPFLLRAERSDARKAMALTELNHMSEKKRAAEAARSEKEGRAVAAVERKAAEQGERDVKASAVRTETGNVREEARRLEKQALEAKQQALMLKIAVSSNAALRTHQTVKSKPAHKIRQRQN